MTRSYSVEELRYLDLAMNFEGRAASKQACVLWAAALAMDLRQGLLTFATLRGCVDDAEAATMGPGASREPFVHAWVEVADAVYAPTLVKRTGVLIAMDRADYYRVNGARDVRQLPRQRFDAEVRRLGLAAALKHQTPRAGSGETAEALLRAAGVRYRVSEGRTILPE